MSRRLIRSLSLALFASTFAIGQDKPSGEFQIPAPPEATQGQSAPTKSPIADLDKRPKLDQHTKMLLIQAINAEFARTRKTFPLGYKEITLTSDGKLKPEDSIAARGSPTRRPSRSWCGRARWSPNSDHEYCHPRQEHLSRNQWWTQEKNEVVSTHQRQRFRRHRRRSRP